MACTKYTEAQYLTLSEAIASGATSVKYGDKAVDYRSLADMVQIQTLMERCLYPERFKNNGRTLASFSKGTFTKPFYGRKCC